MSNPAGWYPDPSNAAQARYWDGSQWTGKTYPFDPRGMASTSAPSMESIVSTAKATLSPKGARLGGIGCVVALFVIGGIGFASCSASVFGAKPQSSSPASQVTQASAAADSLSGNDSVFISYVRSHTTTLGAAPDSNLIRVATTACAALDQGHTVEELVPPILQTAQSAKMRDDLSLMVGAGIQDYCPQYATQFDKYAG
ncbi:DUF2510 domain-containing protein [Arthrobacter sp. NPDC080031]|uniref:DUF2510 domain-containing protein n=1 Tax=Arthrobacter sp. NPDC080031 TaxID=3155918 RepID=UPI00344FD9FA